jgi:NADPH-dependent 2,4-dienoyl-CoA reductase/sulfur reductase-like enzyme
VSRERLLVIGADAAGMSAASQARRLRDADDLEIVAFDRGGYASYSACGIPYLVGGVVTDDAALVVRTPATFRDDYAIDVRLHHEVVGIDLEAGTLQVRSNDEDTSHPEAFDHLVIATGAVPVRPDLPGIDAAGIVGVQTLDDGLALREEMQRRQPARAVIVGAGYIGLEMAEAFSSQGIDTHLVDAAEQPMSTLDPDMGALVAETLREFGTTLHLQSAVTGFEVAAGRVRAVVTDRETIPADIVVLGLGARPNTALAAAAGIALGTSGAIAVDRRQRTDAPAVWAAGDCAEKTHRVSGAPVAIALGTHANKQGRVAGINLGGGYATFPGVVGTAATKVCALEVARTGLSEAEALAAGFAVETVTVASTTRADYYPGAAPITTKLVVEVASARILGAQIVGREGAAKRVDAFALALWNEMTVGDLLNADLSYAPPYAPTWDPVLIAARKADEKLRRGPVPSS